MIFMTIQGLPQFRGISTYPVPLTLPRRHANSRTPDLDRVGGPKAWGPQRVISLMGLVWDLGLISYFVDCN